MDALVLLASTCVLVCVALVVGGGYRYATDRRRLAQERLDAYLRPEKPEQAQGVLAQTVMRENKLSSVSAFDAALKGRDFAQQLALELSQAHVRLRVAEYLFVRVFCAAVFMMVSLAVSGRLLVGLLFGLIGFFLPKLYVVYRRRRRVKEFGEQLVDALDLISNSLRAGHSLLQAIDQAGSQHSPPMSEELQQVLREVSIGSPVETALGNLVARMESYDLRLVATAIITQRSVGGNLAEVLDTIAHTIRERVRVLGQVRILTAESRLSGWILGLLPLAVGVLFYVINPDYMDVMFNTTEGRLALAAAAGLELMGFVALRQLATVDV